MLSIANLFPHGGSSKHVVLVGNFANDRDATAATLVYVGVRPRYSM